MKTQQNVFVVFLVIVGLFFAYWMLSVFFADPLPSHTALFAAREPASESSLDPSWVEGLSDIAPSENLTNKFSLNISNDFIADTAEGANIGSPDTLLSKLDINAIKNPQEFAAYVSPDVLGIASRVNDNRIRVIVESSEANVAAYWQEYVRVIADVSLYQTDNADALLSAATEAVNIGNGEGLDVLIGALETTVDDLELMAVPSALVEFHKDNILFFDNTIVIFRSIQMASIDPLRAYLALEYLPDLEILWTRIGKNIQAASVSF